MGGYSGCNKSPWLQLRGACFVVDYWTSDYRCCVCYLSGQVSYARYG